jgi:predicted 3-demethylubiquinone-9 3-methyltransferase (glyoxalase superfamily)
MSTITPFLWFDTEGEDAAKLYTSIFPQLEDHRRLALRLGRASP